LIPNGCAARRTQAPPPTRPRGAGFLIWRIVAAFADLAGTPPALSSSAVYAVLDGLFQQALIRHLAGSTGAARDLEENVQRVLESLTIRG
jgi:hypothetical protein